MNGIAEMENLDEQKESLDILMQDEDKQDKIIAMITNPDLRFGYVLKLYYSIMGIKMPKQLDLLNEWFGNLVIIVRESDGTKKEPPEYNDMERKIYATRYNDSLYGSGEGHERVTYIVNKLIGTASSNRDKGHLQANIIQKNIARKLSNETSALANWGEYIMDKLKEFPKERLQELHFALYMFVLIASEQYYDRDEYDRDIELFAFDEEVFDQIMYNAFYQLQLSDFDGFVNGFMWLLLGSLLRNACGRICRVFNSSFVPIYRLSSETGHLLDQLAFLIEPEAYEDYYEGNDLERRFPGIEFFCDQCNAHLNEQEGFTDHLDFWQCRKCGHVNPINMNEIYENVEDYNNGIQRLTVDGYKRSIEKRRKEVEEEEEEES